MSERGAGTAAFDVIGTLFSLDPVREEFSATGASDAALESWFAASLRDYFAISHSGGYVPMRAVLEDHLDEKLRGAVMGAMARLEPAPGAFDACELLDDAGWRLLTLTNASEKMTRSLLDSAGLSDHFHAVLSCDSIEKSKPHPDVYALAKREAVGPLWMIASHPWDLGGAAAAGLRTAWVQPEGATWPSYLGSPDLQAGDLAELARSIRAAGAE
jgi:2-haloacid dehalogenase